MINLIVTRIKHLLSVQAIRWHSRCCSKLFKRDFGFARETRVNFKNEGEPNLTVIYFIFYSQIDFVREKLWTWRNKTSIRRPCYAFGKKPHTTMTLGVSPAVLTVPKSKEETTYRYLVPRPESFGQRSFLPTRRPGFRSPIPWHSSDLGNRKVLSITPQLTVTY